MAPVLNMHSELKRRIRQELPDLVADGHRRIWTKVFKLGGEDWAKIDNRLRPVTFDEKRRVFVAGEASLSVGLARYLK